MKYGHFASDYVQIPSLRWEALPSGEPTKPRDLKSARGYAGAYYEQGQNDLLNLAKVRQSTAGALLRVLLKETADGIDYGRKHRPVCYTKAGPFVVVMKGLWREVVIHVFDPLADIISNPFLQLFKQH